MIEKYFKEDYISGKKLVGDDFSLDEIKQWFEEEKEAYAKLTTKGSAKDYYYELINNYNGLDYLISLHKGQERINILCFGAGYGGEVIALEKLLNKYLVKSYNIYILDSSDEILETYDMMKYNIIKASIDGTINIQNDHIDIVTCFGVLHHIPNVSYIIKEFYRILKKNGYCIIREPITSMGIWSNHRYGCTPNERGIPEEIFYKILRKNKFSIISKQYAFFSPLKVILSKLKLSYNSKPVILVDSFLSKFFAWNSKKYYRKSFFDKFAPSSIYWIVKK